MIDGVAHSPRRWTAEGLLDELRLKMYDEDDRRRDEGLPTWLREVLIICDLETQLQMDGLLGWLENAAADDLDLACTALRSIDATDQADLLRRAAAAVPDVSLASGIHEWQVSSFAQRHPDASAKGLAEVREIQTRLWPYDRTSDVENHLLAHIKEGLQNA